MERVESRMTLAGCTSTSTATACDLNLPKQNQSHLVNHFLSPGGRSPLTPNNLDYNNLKLKETGP
ncbi:hypothetical protein OsI_38647 [Oryza sativa Indica Group]|uniref:Uncharacterized protein n=1 Tax=Oryza sativa subsp. indica TaxID=39946 RepID=A2ZLE9_ORYSI|nr:hypothetical protein OsI_38647 [Oryza sativa Indica Group]